MTANDRQASLNYGYDALKDLAAALKISDRDISYQGELSIAFGARGSGNAAAHYEPLRKVINLTKMNGAGSLAHEWWHDLDDFLGAKMGLKGYLSERPYDQGLFKKLIDTVKYKAASPEQAAAAVETSDARIKRSAESWLKAEVLPSVNRSGDEKALESYEALKDAYLRGETGVADKLTDLKKSVSGRVIPKDKRETLNFFERTLRQIAERTETPPARVETDYFRASKEMSKVCEKDGGYWESNVEMTARAFATYVLDTLPTRSDYLLAHAECAVAPNIDKDGNIEIIRAYPEGDERKAINAVFDEIIAELKLQQYLTHDEHIQPEPEISEVKFREPIKSRQASETNENEQQKPPIGKNGGFSHVKGDQLSLFDVAQPESVDAKKPSILGGIAAAKTAAAQDGKQVTDTTKKRDGESL